MCFVVSSIFSDKAARNRTRLNEVVPENIVGNAGRICTWRPPASDDVDGALRDPTSAVGGLKEDNRRIQPS